MIKVRIVEAPGNSVDFNMYVSEEFCNEFSKKDKFKDETWVDDNVLSYTKTPAHVNDTQVTLKLKILDTSDKDWQLGKLRMSVYTDDDSQGFSCDVAICEAEKTYWVWNSIGCYIGYDGDCVYLGTSPAWSEEKKRWEQYGGECVDLAEIGLRRMLGHEQEWKIKEASRREWFALNKKYNTYAVSQVDALKEIVYVTPLVAEQMQGLLVPLWLAKMQSIMVTDVDSWGERGTDTAWRASRTILDKCCPISEPDCWDMFDPWADLSDDDS